MIEVGKVYQVMHEDVIGDPWDGMSGIVVDVVDYEGREGFVLLMENGKGGIAFENELTEIEDA